MHLYWLKQILHQKKNLPKKIFNGHYLPKFSQPERAKYEWHPRGVQHKTTLFPDFFSRQPSLITNKVKQTSWMLHFFFFKFQLPTPSRRFFTQFFRIHLSFTNSFKAILMALEMT